MKKSLLFLITFYSTISFAQCWDVISGGDSYTLAIKKDKTLWAWGRNIVGQLGDGTTTNRSTPTQIGNDNDWISVEGRLTHSVALKSDGTIWAWGRNFAGQLGNGNTTNLLIPTQVGTDSDWKIISAGGSTTLAIKNDGSLWSWGDSELGILGDGSTNDRYIPARVGTENSWQSVNISTTCAIAIKTNGTLWAWGRNDRGALGDGTNVDRTVPTQVGTDNNWKVAVTTSSGFSLALKTDGTIWSWGYNANGELGQGSFQSGINRPIQIGTDSDWQSVSAMFVHTLAIKNDGTLWAWGYNQTGALGDGTIIDKNTPLQIGTDTDWEKPTATGFNSYALKSDGSLRVWGSNSYGQLGNNQVVNVSQRTPIAIACPLSLGLETFDNKNLLTIYPNPVSENFQIREINPSASITIYDIMGTTVKTIVKNNGTVIDVRDLMQGIYLIKVTNINGSFLTGRFVKL